MARNRNIYSPDSLEQLIAERAPGPRDASGAIVRMCERYAELVAAGAGELKLPLDRWREMEETWAELPAGPVGLRLSQARILLGLETLLEAAAVVDVLERIQAEGLVVAKGSLADLGIHVG